MAFLTSELVLYFIYFISSLGNLYAFLNSAFFSRLLLYFPVVVYIINIEEKTQSIFTTSLCNSFNSI